MSEDNPKISIVLPTYNGAAFLSASIKSCLKQTHRNLELIIVDDGSTDRTAEIVRFFQDERIKYVHQSPNQGHIKALNKGFSLATGDFLTWTSDDNYYSVKALETMLNVLQDHKTVDFVYANYCVVDERDVYKRMGRVEPPKGLDFDNYVGGCFLYRRNVYETIGNFNEEAFLAEDYEYWLRVREKFVMKNIPEVLYYYRAHEKSLTGQHKEDKVQEQVEKIRDRFIREWLKLYLHGKKFYIKQDYPRAKVCFKKSLGLNPFHLSTWRYLAMLYLDRSLIEGIRKVKHAVKPGKSG